MSVEFLSGAVPGEAPEERLDVPARSGWRGWWVLAMLVAGVTVWALTVSSQAPPARHRAGPAPTMSARADRPCRGLAGCSVRGGVPPAIVRLARAYLPPGVQLRVRTVVAAASRTGGTLFVARDIDAHVDSVTVLIRVRRAGSGTQQIVPDPFGVDSLLLHQVNSGFVVRLQYLAPDNVAPMVNRLRALLRDPRLTSS
ncbi:MAG TPA: hypothetical protein VE441_11470 [Mycobacterium sp.]|jgi:hypothetical protein|nr:hypothetical protein [Mycobacterium sp.]